MVAVGNHLVTVRISYRYHPKVIAEFTSIYCGFPVLFFRVGTLLEPFAGAGATVACRHLFAWQPGVVAAAGILWGGPVSGVCPLGAP